MVIWVREGRFRANGQEHTFLGYANLDVPVVWNPVTASFDVSIDERAGERFFDLDIEAGTAVEIDTTSLHTILDSVLTDGLVRSYVARVTAAYPVVAFDLAEMYEIESAARLEMTPAAFYSLDGYEIVSGATH